MANTVYGVSLGAHKPFTAGLADQCRRRVMATEIVLLASLSTSCYFSRTLERWRAMSSCARLWTNVNGIITKIYQLPGASGIPSVPPNDSYSIDTSFASDWSLQRAYCIKGKFTSLGVYKGIVLACASDRALSCWLNSWLHTLLTTPLFLCFSQQSQTKCKPLSGHK